MCLQHQVHIYLFYLDFSILKFIEQIIKNEIRSGIYGLIMFKALNSSVLNTAVFHFNHISPGKRLQKIILAVNPSQQKRVFFQARTFAYYEPSNFEFFNRS